MPTEKRSEKSYKRPSAAQMDEPLKVPLTPTELAEGLLQAGPHPEDETDCERARQPSADDD